MQNKKCARSISAKFDWEYKLCFDHQCCLWRHSGLDSEKAINVNYCSIKSRLSP